MTKGTFLMLITAILVVAVAGGAAMMYQFRCEQLENRLAIMELTEAINDLAKPNRVNKTLSGRSPMHEIALEMKQGATGTEFILSQWPVNMESLPQEFAKVSGKVILLSAGDDVPYEAIGKVIALAYRAGLVVATTPGLREIEARQIPETDDGFEIKNRLVVSNGEKGVVASFIETTETSVYGRRFSLDDLQKELDRIAAGPNKKMSVVAGGKVPFDVVVRIVRMATETGLTVSMHLPESAENKEQVK